MTDLKQDFLQGMSFAAATVNIVTTGGPAGRSGVTVSAMSSVSADTENPTLLVCINDASSGAAPIMDNGVFCVNILRDDQSFISDTFAGRYGDKGEAKFACGNWQELATGAPALENALVSFDCRLTNDVIVGTHHVFFGEVQAMKLADTGLPLIYANRSYGTPFSLPNAALEKSSRQEKVDRVRLGCLNSFGPFILPELLTGIQQKEPSLQIEVIEGDQAQAVDAAASHDVDFSIVYDRHLPDSLSVKPLAELRPYILLPKSHILASEKSVSLAQLQTDPLILLDAPLSREYFLSLFEAAGLKPQIGMRTSSFELVRSMVANGAGYALLVTKPANMMSYDGKELITKQITDDVETIGISIVRRSGADLSDMTKSVENYCQQYFAALKNSNSEA